MRKIALCLVLVIVYVCVVQAQTNKTGTKGLGMINVIIKGSPEKKYPVVAGVAYEEAGPYLTLKLTTFPAQLTSDEPLLANHHFAGNNWNQIHEENLLPRPMGKSPNSSCRIVEDQDQGWTRGFYRDLSA